MSDEITPPPPPPPADVPPPAGPPQPPIEAGVPPAPTGTPSKDETNFAMFTHLAGLLALTSIPGGGIVGPLVMWMIKKDTMPFVDDQGKEAINFHISVAIGVLISWALSFVCIGIPLLIAILIASIVFSVIAAVSASKGEAYRYPFSLRLLK